MAPAEEGSITRARQGANLVRGSGKGSNYQNPEETCETPLRNRISVTRKGQWVSCRHREF
jgi:hypothetical protein